MKWTKEDDRKLLQMKNEGFTINAMAETFNRSTCAIKSRLGNLYKTENTYNSDHIEEKYEMNKEFLYEINPKTILDLFSGKTGFWKKNYSELFIISNDKEKNISADIHSDAEEFLRVLKALNISFDLIDVDPFGSPEKFLDNSILLATKGLIVTFGDINRFKRYPNRYQNYMLDTYGINKSLSKVTLQDLEQLVIDRANKLGKTLEVYAACNWKSASRIWFKVV